MKLAQRILAILALCFVGYLPLRDFADWIVGGHCFGPDCGFSSMGLAIVYSYFSLPLGSIVSIMIGFGGTDKVARIIGRITCSFIAAYFSTSYVIWHKHKTEENAKAYNLTTKNHAAEKLNYILLRFVKSEFLNNSNAFRFMEDEDRSELVDNNSIVELCKTNTDCNKLDLKLVAGKLSSSSVMGDVLTDLTVVIDRNVDGQADTVMLRASPDQNYHGGMYMDSEWSDTNGAVFSRGYQEIW